MLEGTPWGAHWHFLLVGPRSKARTVDPRTLRAIRLKYKIWPWGPKCGTDSLGLSPKATGLHLVGVRGDTLGRTLALPASWAEVRGSNGGPSDFAFYTIKIGNLALGSQVWHGFSGLKSKGNGVTPSRCWRGHPGEHLPLVGPRSGARTVDPRTLRSIQLK